MQWHALAKPCINISFQNIFSSSKESTYYKFQCLLGASNKGHLDKFPTSN